MIQQKDSIGEFKVYRLYERWRRGSYTQKVSKKYLKFNSDLYPDAMVLFDNYTSQMFPEVDYER